MNTVQIDRKTSERMKKIASKLSMRLSSTREDFEVGDEVYFKTVNGKQSLGRIRKLNPSKAKVELLEKAGKYDAGGIWTVPYEMMTLKQNGRPKQKRRKTRSERTHGEYVDSVIDGVKVTQVQTNNNSTRAVLRGSTLLVKWGEDDVEGSNARRSKLPKCVKWAKGKLGRKQERVEQKKEWTRTIEDGYSVYDLDGKEQVAAILAKVERDVRPLLREFNLKYVRVKESVSESTLGFINSGKRIIALNVRQKVKPMKLRKYSAIMRTMIHELAHLRYMNHSSKFREFDAELLVWARKKGVYAP